MATKEEFAKTVQAALDRGVSEQEFATEFECALATPKRWANGTAVPMPRTMEMIMQWCANK